MKSYEIDIKQKFLNTLVLKDSPAFGHISFLLLLNHIF